jgi:hypothetical protein
MDKIELEARIVRLTNRIVVLSKLAVEADKLADLDRAIALRNNALGLAKFLITLIKNEA